MAQASDSQGDDRIEELLSNLKNIFSNVPRSSEAAPEPTKPNPPEDSTAPVTPPPKIPAPSTESVKAVPPPSDGTTPTLIYYPTGRETEAATLGQKLETMTPKFTKVTFQLKIREYLPYEVKSDWPAGAVAKVKTEGIQVLYVITEKPLDPAIRETLAGELDQEKVYFNEVPLLSIEKKAFYTDQLLGLIFFFDSQKPQEKQE